MDHHLFISEWWCVFVICGKQFFVYMNIRNTDRRWGDGVFVFAACAGATATVDKTQHAKHIYMDGLWDGISFRAVSPAHTPKHTTHAHDSWKTRPHPQATTLCCGSVVVSQPHHNCIRKRTHNFINTRTHAQPQPTPFGHTNLNNTSPTDREVLTQTRHPRQTPTKKKQHPRMPKRQV